MKGLASGVPVERINAAWANALVDGLVAAGVAHAVISPGTRSGPLALACLRHPALSTHVVLDERAAGFFALGLAKAEGCPAMLICTSGSAVANWHPAVVEADMARLPLILLSADRGPEDQDCGTPQTIDQQRLFGPHLRAFHALPPAEPACGWLPNLAARAVSQSRWPLPGPVQVNVPFREPLLAATDDEMERIAVPAPQVILPRLSPPPEELDRLARILSGRTGVIVAGAEPLPAAAIAHLAASLGWPIVADPLSGLRFGPHDRSQVISRAALFLRGGSFRPECILRFGAFPVSESVGGWLARTGARQIVVSADPRWPDPQRSADIMVHADPEAVALGLADRIEHAAPQDWFQGFASAASRAAALAHRFDMAEARIIAAAIESLPDQALFFVGNSMAVRDLDAFSGISAKRITVMCNRGANGIDGNLSTFLGAAASGRFSASFALVGDLTFCHDVGALAAGRGVNGAIAVLDNGGGNIFKHLPQAQLPEFERGWLVPPRADLAAAAATWGHGYGETEPPRMADALCAALGRPGLSVLRIPIDADESVRQHRALWTAVQSLETV